MISVYHRFSHDETIPVEQYLKNRKIKKYFNGETSAAVLCMGELMEKTPINPHSTPVYYATGILEYEDYGLAGIVSNSIDGTGHYSPHLFISRGLSNVSPLNQFKILHNMPLSFISIAFGFTSDNSSLYSSAIGLVVSAKTAATEERIIIGSGKGYRDGSIECGFALISKDEVDSLPVEDPQEEAVLMFRRLAERAAS